MAPVEVAVGVTAGLFHWASRAREAWRLSRWQRRKRQHVLHELIDENDRYFLAD